MALKRYGQLKVFLNGANVEQLTSVEHVTNSGQQRVDLLNEGLAGFTPGGGDCTVTLGVPVPLGGTEHPYQEWCHNGEPVYLQLIEGTRSFSSWGIIETYTVSQSQGANTEATVNWLGQRKPFEA